MYCTVWSRTHIPTWALNLGARTVPVFIVCFKLVRILCVMLAPLRSSCVTLTTCMVYPLFHGWSLEDVLVSMCCFQLPYWLCIPKTSFSSSSRSRAYSRISHNTAGTQITGYLIAVITINCHVQLKRNCRLCRQAYRYNWAISKLVVLSNVIASSF